jgi:hypothetical protein
MEFETGKPNTVKTAGGASGGSASLEFSVLPALAPLAIGMEFVAPAGENVWAFRFADITKAQNANTKTDLIDSFTSKFLI